ncbi:hypothetical protein BIU87_03600 [Streptomyces sp. ZS0098]|uniref:hypothetical protein n=2 Tax=Streptomyces TaxID=1883 RepID=UPI000EFB38BA|nr:hypothetical protein [Streptomyces sp. ZS0098]RMI89339.1 hypothetical protein BIU87_03600 [Streptomyces sp. ZS0098]
MADFSEERTATAPGSKEGRAGAVESCVTVTPAPVTAPAKARARIGSAVTPSVATSPAGSCDITSPGTYRQRRFSYCVTGIHVTYVLRHTNSAELGRAVLQVSTGGTLFAQATTWSE